MNVLVIDSGITLHLAFKNIELKLTGYKGQNCLDDVFDTTGHGTAITSLIIKGISSVSIYVLKIFNDHFECDIDELIQALTFISKNNIYDVINMSFGLTVFEESRQIKELEKLCKLLSEQGSILTAAFDNDGAISYPAFFDCVVGVETSKEARNRKEYEYVVGSCVNLMGYGATQKVAWSNPQYTIINGTSFACANITNIILTFLETGCTKSNLFEVLHNHSLNNLIFDDYQPLEKRPPWITGMKAILFPFSKEIHSLVAFEDLLDFEISGIYDVKHTSHVGKHISEIINYRYVVDRKIENYMEIQWDSEDFNAVIIGHLSELSTACRKDLLGYFMKQSIMFGKKIYAFDDLQSIDDNMIDPYKDSIYFPIITDKNIPKGRFGKLHNINIPVLAIVGTASSQGKYTVQLLLRNQLLKYNYKVGQIGSEPTSYCFGMDVVYPYGYSSTTYTSGYPNILLLNQAVHEMDMDDRDICLVGTQANTAFYSNNNLNNIPLKQLEVLYGTMPDAFILVINAHDDIDYIIRTLKGMEFNFESKCIAIVIYPIMKKFIIGSLYRNENVVDSDFYRDFKRVIIQATSVPVLDMAEILSSEILTQLIIEFF